MTEPRKSNLSIYYKEKNISRNIIGYLQNFTYEDSADGESDTVTITLGDKTRKWTGSWMPEKGERISATISVRNWNKYGDRKKLSCGEFVIDSLSASGEPLTIEIGAISGPVSSGFRETSRHKTWKKTNLKQIAEKIAKRYKLKLHYDAGSIPIKEVEQSDNDSSFLASICETYGLTMKAYKKKLVIYDRERYKKKKAVLTIDRKTSAAESWSYSDTLAKRYTGGQLTYTDPKTDKDVKKTIGKKTVLLKLEDSADSAADAERKIRAAVNNENHGKTTMSIEMMGNTRITAGICINLKNWGSKISGKYYVNKATHTISDSGYTLSLELSKVVASV